MPTVITGTDGINQVQAGAVESGDLPAGSVIQVVNATEASLVTTNSSTFISLGITASITPTNASNKIIIISSIYVEYDNDTSGFGGVDLQIQANSSPIVTYNRALSGRAGPSNGYDFIISTNVLNTFVHEPNSINTQTYEFFGQRGAGDSNVFAKFQSRPDRIILMEVAG